MALVKQVDEVLKLDNKEMLLVALLERLCHSLDNENGLFKSTCQYLNNIGLLEEPKLYADNKKQLRNLYGEYLVKLISNRINPAIATNSIVTMDKLIFNNSLYSMNFIELEPLGKGGFGEVFKVYNRLDTQRYAIKRIPFKKVNDPNNIRAFNEVRCLSELNHNNIARYYTAWLELSDRIIIDDEDDFSEQPSVSVYPVMYIQMELCNSSLREYLVKRDYSGIKGDMRVERNIITGIISGLSYIHEHDILHRDLNPNNIFLDSKMNPKIGDFGMAVKIGNDPKMESDLGVDLYMPPEYKLHNVYTKKSDVYSTGIILFEIFNHFGTDMERYKVVTEVKSGVHKAESEFAMIYTMIRDNPEKRPDICDVFL
jgi:serine/threonine protein kinase